MADINNLLASCLADMTALEALYRLFKKDVFIYAFSITNDYSAAEECVQETFIRLPRATAAAGNIRNGKAFILSITRHVALELIRGRKKYMLTDAPLEFEAVRQAAPLHDEIEARQMLDGLDDDQRQIVVMHVFNDLTFQDIARALEFTVSTVKYKYKKAKTIIRSRMEVLPS